MSNQRVRRAMLSCLALVAVTASSPMLVTDSDLNLPFFQKLWAGSAFDNLPEGMPNPRALKRAFEAEPRSVNWATQAELEIDRSISRIQNGQVTAKRVRCHHSICEAIFVIPVGSISDASELRGEVDRYFGASALVLDKELTLAVGGGKVDVMGFLAYFHDEYEVAQ